MANQITSLRLILAILCVLALSHLQHFSVYIIAVIPIIMILDLFDGLIARKTQTVSLFGAVFDIAADRFIELLFFIFFAVSGLLGFWAVFLMLCRGITLDTIRSLTHFQNKTAFGSNSFHKTRLAKILTTSQFSRGLYNTLKTVSFTCLALALFQKNIITFAIILTWLTILMALLRSFPVILEGIEVVKKLNKPLNFI